MKRIYPLFLFLAMSFQTRAQCSWNAVGNYDSSLVSNHFTDFATLAVNDSNDLYIAYSDMARGGKACVKKYSNGSWITLGYEGFTAGASLYNSLVVSKSGVPYLAFIDNSTGAKASVMKFNGTSWVLVGNAGLSDSSIVDISLDLDSTGTPYIAYTDKGQGNKITVKYFNGTSWTALGGAGFTTGKAFYPSLRISPAGVIHVAYRDEAHFNKASVSFYNGSNWNILASPGISSGPVTKTTLDFDSSGVAYVALLDSFSVYSHTVTVKKFNGTSWSSMGTIPGNYWFTFAFKVTLSGTPYLMTSASNSMSYTVRKFNGVAWQSISSLYYGQGNFDIISLAVDKTGNAFVSYQYGHTNVLKLNGDLTENISMPGITPLFSSLSCLAVNDSGVPYVVDGPSVYKFNGVGWEQVGSPDTSSYYVASLAFDSMQTPYLSYRYYNINYKFYIKKFNGNSWVPVGSVITDLYSYYNPTYLMFDATDTLYVASPSRVYKFKGTAWNTLGSEIGSSGSKIATLSLNTSGKPMVVYVAHDQFQYSKVKLHVAECNDTSWVEVGTPSGTMIGSDDVKAVITSTGKAFATVSGMINGPLKLLEFDGTSWSFLGDSMNTAISSQGVEWPALVADSSGTPFICFSPRYSSSQSLYVYKWNGTALVNTGVIAHLDPKSEHHFAINPITNTPYVSFSNFCSFVKKWECVNLTAIDNLENDSKSDLYLFPNPISSKITIASSEKINELRLLNILGEELLKKIVNDNETCLDLSALISGIYLVEVICDNKIQVRKIVKE